MRWITMTFSLAAAAIRQFWKTEVESTEGERATLPPIRYDGDPRDIYLA